MSDNIKEVFLAFIFFGWIPILTLGKTISWCIKANACNKCTCKECAKEREE